MRCSGRFSDMWASTRSITRTNPSTFSSQQVSVAWNCFQRSRHKSLQPRWTTTNYDNCKTSKMQRSSSRSHDFDVVQALPHLAAIGISKHRRARMQTRKWGTGESCCVEGNAPVKVVDTVVEDIPPWPAKMKTKQSEIACFCRVKFHQLILPSSSRAGAGKFLFANLRAPLWISVLDLSHVTGTTSEKQKKSFELSICL